MTFATMALPHAAPGAPAIVTESPATIELRTARPSDAGAIHALVGGVTAPAGFRASGVACGIKANGNPDLALLTSDRPAAAAAVFTTNVAQAAPIVISKEHLERTGGEAVAVVINSGCANACTGADGIDHAREMTARTAAALGCAPEAVLVASTGVIGVKLPMPQVIAGIDRAAAALSRRAAPTPRAPS
jgi:glutamate N-acetyltransferase / amino-acid N-acetyltransferase